MASWPQTEIKPLRGEVEFKDVSFGYPRTNDKSLKHINLKIPAGTSMAIVGATGAGKTTLINLIGRFYEATSTATCWWMAAMCVITHSKSCATRLATCRRMCCCSVPRWPRTSRLAGLMPPRSKLSAPQS